MPLDLDLIKDILVKDFNTFADRGVYYNEEADPLSAHLFSIEGDKWKFLRKKLNPTFTSGKMKMMYHTITSKGEDLLEAVDRNQLKGPIDAKKLSILFTSDVIANCGFGLECGGLKNDGSDIVDTATKVFDFKGLRLIYMFLLESFKDLSRKLGLRQFHKEVEDYFMGIIKDTLKHRKENNVVRHDFMNLLIQLMEKGNIDEEVGGTDTRKITFNELAAQAFLFLFAGFETTSTTMSFMLYEVAENLEIQEKVRAEVQRVLETHNGEITYEAVQEMTYLQKVFNGNLKWICYKISRF
jgi:cytochrome P450 family 6